MAQTNYYGRSPLPAEAKAPAGLMMLLWMAVVFSPFVAFTVNGKVDDSNWTPAFVTAGLALFGLALLSARTRSNYRNLPSHLREEYERGKCFAAMTNARVRLPRDFKLTAKVTLQLTSDGIAASPGAWLGLNAGRRADVVRMLLRTGRVTPSDLPPQLIAWRDIKEWQVHNESESADYYHLSLADGGHVRLRRPSDAKEEYELLDSVRGAGRVPVRVFCDIPRPQAG